MLELLLRRLAVLFLHLVLLGREWVDNDGGMGTMAEPKLVALRMGKLASEQLREIAVRTLRCEELGLRPL
eukprot:CAMPEP_0117576414 /NCGR_PEP_ID=MMETSP0784-20121206/62784_1 /TAXON_ID=39447 /ORGANISM="" /LENGTH=69 /DNA_ID=CAMNT_0005375663 /DNA_START=102 /DNA_END=311 /DNA_ORIENTATION=-